MLLFFTKSNILRKKASSLIPGGAHTYSKGDDQFPELSPHSIVKGKGARIWDAHLGVSGAIGAGNTSIGTRVTDSTGTTVEAVAGILVAASHASAFNRKIETGQTSGTASVVPLSYPDGAWLSAPQHEDHVCHKREPFRSLSHAYNQSGPCQYCQ